MSDDRQKTPWTAVDRKVAFFYVPGIQEFGVGTIYRIFFCEMCLSSRKDLYMKSTLLSQQYVWT